MHSRAGSAATGVGRPQTQHAPATVWADGLDPADRGVLDPGVPGDLDRRPDVLVVGGG